MRFLILILFAVALIMLLPLTKPSNDNSWTESPSYFFKGANMYPEKEVTAMLNGKLDRFSEGFIPVEPEKYAQRILDRGRLIEVTSGNGGKFYVLPKMHPGLGMVHPAMSMFALGAILLFFQTIRGHGS